MAAFILALLPAYVFAQQVQFQLDFKIAEHYQGKSGEESKTEVNIKQGPSIVTLALKEISVRSGDREGKAHKFYYEGEEVVSYQLSERAHSQALADIYKKYLTYEHNVHSVIV